MNPASNPEPHLSKNMVGTGSLGAFLQCNSAAIFLGNRAAVLLWAAVHGGGTSKGLAGQEPVIRGDSIGIQRRQEGIWPTMGETRGCGECAGPGHVLKGQLGIPDHGMVDAGACAGVFWGTSWTRGGEGG